jgi:hypothetical protein
LDTAFLKYREDAHAAIGSEVENGGRVHIGRMGDLPEPDPEWSITIGECLYNMRSALDHLVHAIAADRQWRKEDRIR